ncbi:MAG: surface protein [Bacteroidaceae bacterium]|nr:surface protein [Bacteroidaceae bacterium]
MQNLWAYIQGLNLTYDERHWLADQLCAPTHVQEDLTPYTVEELVASVQEGMRQIEAGEYYTHEEVMRDLYELTGVPYSERSASKEHYAESL